jgi:hypothetical protein
MLCRDGISLVSTICYAEAKILDDWIGNRGYTNKACLSRLNLARVSVASRRLGGLPFFQERFPNAYVCIGPDFQSVGNMLALGYSTIT